MVMRAHARNMSGGSLFSGLFAAVIVMLREGKRAQTQKKCQSKYEPSHSIDSLRVKVWRRAHLDCSSSG
jgi:hypothetical protein